MELRCTKDMVEVAVGQHDMAHLAARERLHIRTDRAGFGQRRAGIDQYGSRSVPHQADRHIQERQSGASYAVRQPFPRIVH